MSVGTVDLGGEENATLYPPIHFDSPQIDLQVLNQTSDLTRVTALIDNHHQSKAALIVTCSETDHKGDKVNLS